MDNNNIDSLFKKALREEKCDPPAYIWERINERMAERHRRKMIGWWRGVAAITLLGACIWLWQLQQETTPDLYVMEYILPVPHESIQADIPSVSRKSLSENTKNVIEVASDLPRKSESIHRTIAPAEILIADAFIVDHPTSPSAELNTSSLRKNFIPLVNKTALENNQEYLALLSQTEPDPEKQKKDLQVALSGHFTPAYSSGSYSSNLVDPRGYSYSQNQMNGIMNMGGGIKVAISTGKRLSVQTGLSYSRMGQRTSEPGGVMASSLNSLKSVDKYITTPLGNIQSATRAIGYRSSEALGLERIGYMDESIEQVFGTLEIPLLVRYQLNDNRIRVSLAGGFCSNIIVSNKVYLEAGGNRELAGSTENIRNFNVSTDLSLGVEYPVTNKIRIMIEPGFKYYLQSLSRNNTIDYKPYIFSFSTGIGFVF